MVRVQIVHRAAGCLDDVKCEQAGVAGVARQRWRAFAGGTACQLKCELPTSEGIVGGSTRQDRYRRRVTSHDRFADLNGAVFRRQVFRIVKRESRWVGDPVGNS